MKVTTAVIPAAGYGTRMLPITAGVQKVLLPIVDRPIVDYVVDDCLAAGITNIIFITNPGSRDLQNYYSGNQDLERHLKRFNKTAALEKLNAIHTKATFSFIEQPFENVGYGTNVPLALAAPHLPKDEAFVVTNGDAFTWSPDGHSDTKMLVEAFNQTDATGGIMVKEMPEDQLHRYGVAAVEERDGVEYLHGFVEQPKPGQAPSNLASLFNYVFTPEIIPYVIAGKPNATGEAQLTDALLACAKEHPIIVQRARGRWIDGGNLTSWFEANLILAAHNPDLAAIVKVGKKI